MPLHSVNTAGKAVKWRRHKLFMVVLVDANVFVDYEEGEAYARRFFREAMENGIEIAKSEGVSCF